MMSAQKPYARLQPPGQRTLCRLNQPTGVADEYLGDRAGIQTVEKCLDLLQARGRGIISVIPYPEAEMFQLPKDEHGVQPARVRQADIPSWPAMALPVPMGPTDELHRIEVVGGSFESDRLESIRQVRGCELPLKAGQRTRKSGHGEKARFESLLDVATLSADIQCATVDALDDVLAPIEESRTSAACSPKFIAGVCRHRPAFAEKCVVSASPDAASSLATAPPSRCRPAAPGPLRQRRLQSKTIARPSCCEIIIRPWQRLRRDHGEVRGRNGGDESGPRLSIEAHSRVARHG